MPDQKIHHHEFPNGLTLVAEEMDWLESAASKGEKKEDKKLIEADIIKPPAAPVVAEFAPPKSRRLA